MKAFMILATIAVVSSFASAQEVEVRGTGPIRVKCISEDSYVKIYNVNSISIVESKKGQVIIANGFGPDRGDEGFVKLQGACEITSGNSAE